MKSRRNADRWHWNRPAVVCFVILLIVTASWPLLARSENAVSTGRADKATSDQTHSQPEAIEGEKSTAAPGDHAARVLIPQHNLISILKNGGPMMVPLIACSFILVVFTFERAFSLRRRRIIPKPFVRKLLHQLRDGQLDRESALELCEQNRSVVATVFAAAIRKWGRPAVEVEQAILDAGERAANGLRRYLRVINIVATVSPLLGLQGTVFGMITSFNDIATAEAMGHPERLASGISVALLTTAGGLTVAIPALILYMLFLSRVDRLVMDIDALGQEVVAAISAEGLSENAGRPRTKKKAA